mmetsp:Transcript_3259/g.9471  ORF Transcript_3259/g.9471 Transcript_3259/m.9471 type:complete len:450 (-) Transcript_3259:771-2120(-)
MIVELVVLAAVIATASAETLNKFEVLHPEAVCNDGTPAVYWRGDWDALPPDAESKLLVFLQSGGDCWSPEACAYRWGDAPYLMTSKGEADTKDFTPEWQPALTDDCAVNPAFCDHLKVFVHYCSSDDWSGNTSADVTGNFHFRGHIIVREVVSEVLDAFHAGGDGRRIASFVFMGQSAGATGAMAQTEYVHRQVLGDLRERGFSTTVQYRTVVDSGWNLDGPGYPGAGAGMYDCPPDRECNLQKRFAMARDYWNLTPGPTCAAELGDAERHLCLFPDWSYEPTRRGMGNAQLATGLRLRGGWHEWREALPASFFVTLYNTDTWQAFNDQADFYGVDAGEQLWINGHRAPEALEQLDRRARNDESFGYFMPSCYEHVLSSDSAYYDVAVGGVALNQALARWVTGFGNGSGGSASRYHDDCGELDCNPTCPSHAREDDKKVSIDDTSVTFG